MDQQEQEPWNIINPEDTWNAPEDWLVDNDDHPQDPDPWTINHDASNPDGNLLKDAPGCLLYDPKTNQMKALHPFKQQQAKVIEDEVIDMKFLENWLSKPLTDDFGVIKYSNPDFITPVAPENPITDPLEIVTLVPEPLARVRIRYEGRKENGELLDKLRDRRQLKAFKLQADDMITGMHKAVGSLTKGETAWFKFLPEYHYGKDGMPNLVEKDAVLYYKIELVDFTNQKKVIASDDYEGRIEFLTDARDKGNAAFAAKDYEKAFNMYKRGIETIRNLPKVLAEKINEDQKKELRDFQIKFANNALMACIKRQEYKEGLVYADMVLNLEAENTKALFRKGQCWMELKELDDALGCFKESLKYEEGDKSEIERQIEVCKKRMEHKLKNDKKRYQHVFKAMGEDEQREIEEKAKREKLERKMEREELAKFHDPILNGQGVKKMKTESQQLVDQIVGN